MSLFTNKLVKRLRVEVQVTADTEIQLTEMQYLALLNGQARLEDFFTADCYLSNTGDPMSKEDLGGNYTIEAKEDVTDAE